MEIEKDNQSNQIQFSKEKPKKPKKIVIITQEKPKLSREDLLDLDRLDRMDKNDIVFLAKKYGLKFSNQKMMKKALSEIRQFYFQNSLPEKYLQGYSEKFKQMLFYQEDE